MAVAEDEADGWLAGGGAGEFGSADTGNPDEGVADEYEGSLVAPVAGDMGIDEDVLDFFRGGCAEGYEAVAGAAGTDGEDGGQAVGGKEFAGVVVAGIGDEFGVDFGEGEDRVLAPVPEPFGEGCGVGFEAQAGVVEDEDGAGGKGDFPGVAGGLGEGLAEAGEIGVAEGNVVSGFGFEPLAEGAGQEGGREVSPAVGGQGGGEGFGGLGFEMFGIFVQGGEGAVESGVAVEDVPEEREEAVADGVAAVGVVGVGVVFAPVGDALAAEVFAEFAGGECEQGAEETDAADFAFGAEGGEAAGIGSSGETEEEGFEGVVGMVAEGDGIAGGDELPPLFEAAAAGGGFGAFAWLPVFGNAETMAGEGDGPAGAEFLAPSGVGVGVGFAETVVKVVGGEGELEFVEEEEECGAVGSAAEARENSVHAVEQVLFGDAVGESLGGWAEWRHVGEGG